MYDLRLFCKILCISFQCMYLYVGVLFLLSVVTKICLICYMGTCLLLLSFVLYQVWYGVITSSLVHCLEYTLKQIFIFIIGVVVIIINVIIIIIYYSFENIICKIALICLF